MKVRNYIIYSSIFLIFISCKEFKKHSDLEDISPSHFNKESDYGSGKRIIKKPLVEGFIVEEISFGEMIDKPKLILRINDSIKNGTVSDYSLAVHVYSDSSSVEKPFLIWDIKPEVEIKENKKYIIIPYKEPIQKIDSIVFFLYDRDIYRNRIGNKIVIEDINLNPNFNFENGGVKFSDNFDYLNLIWITNEVTSSSRYEIVKDPINNQNSVLKFYLLPEDKIHGGRRSEFILPTRDGQGLKVNYSFEILFSEEFLVKNKERDFVMLHQWHDNPPQGVKWKDYQVKTEPPVSLIIEINPDGKYYLAYVYGLWEKDNQKKQTIFRFDKPVQPNLWYKFENTILWSLDEKGYSVPLINDKYLVKKQKVMGANMYNEMPNYYKMGLYGNGQNTDTIFAYFDDFRYHLVKD